jgi:glucose/mannose-6-phosphate isomerase
LCKAIVVQAKGETEIEQLLYTILLGDYVSAYVGILNGINPTPVELVEKLKKELG